MNSQLFGLDARSAKMTDFLSNHASALFTLVGVFVGAGASFITPWVMKKREVQLRLTEKILDRRIEAHERVIDLIMPMRTTVQFDWAQAEGDVVRTPAPLQSEEAFQTWYANHHAAVRDSNTWLSTDVRRELNLFQDYIVNLNNLLEKVDDEDYPKVGHLVRQDFISFSERIHKLAFRFFDSDLTDLKLNRINEWHKYPEAKTIERLEQTNLRKKSEALESLIRREAI